MANIDSDRGTREKVRFLDTAGLDTGDKGASELLPRHLLALADGFVIVFAVDDERSFVLADALRRDLDKKNTSGVGRDKKDLVIIALANKSDCSEKSRTVDFAHAQSWAAREKIRLFEVSGLDRATLYEPFVYLASRLNPPPNKSTFSQLAIGRSRQVRTSGGADA